MSSAVILLLHNIGCSCTLWITPTHSDPSQATFLPLRFAKLVWLLLFLGPLFVTLRVVMLTMPVMVASVLVAWAGGNSFVATSAGSLLHLMGVEGALMAAGHERSHPARAANNIRDNRVSRDIKQLT